MALWGVSAVAWVAVALVGVAGLVLLIRVVLTVFRRLRELNATLAAARGDLATALESINSEVMRTRDGLERLEARRAGETPEPPARGY
jgi:hypothetical protein